MTEWKTFIEATEQANTSPAPTAEMLETMASFLIEKVGPVMESAFGVYVTDLEGVLPDQLPVKVALRRTIKAAIGEEQAGVEALKLITWHSQQHWPSTVRLQHWLVQQWVKQSNRGC